LQKFFIWIAAYVLRLGFAIIRKLPNYLQREKHVLTARLLRPGNTV